LRNRPTGSPNPAAISGLAPTRKEGASRYEHQYWERLGAASGIVAAILFGVSFIIFLGNDPTDLPDVLHAGDYAEFGREHQEALKERSGSGSGSAPSSCG